MIRLSFILPCYNVGRYIGECLDSIYSQGVAENEFEVIAVNDCSTDGTRTVLAGYAEKHANLTILDHKQNLTSGGARNTGIQAAKGDFIWFVDPDDAIRDHCLGEVMGRAAEKDADILYFNYFDCDENLESRRADHTFSDTGVLPGQQYVQEYFPGRFPTFGIVWRAIFKTRFLQENGPRFPIMRKAQDVVFLWRAMLSAGRVCSVDAIYYLYRNNPYSVMKHQLEARVAFSDRILRGYEIASMLSGTGTDILPSIREDMLRAVKWCSDSNLEPLALMSGKERANYYSEIKAHKEAVACLKPQMNRKSRLLFDTSLGKGYWLCKCDLLCRREMKRKGR